MPDSARVEEWAQKVVEHHFENITFSFISATLRIMLIRSSLRFLCRMQSLLI